MKIKRTFAPTMREALAIVKLEQGPDAVIMGNQKVPGGIEILSAIDFDLEQEIATTAAVIPARALAPLVAQNDIANDAWVGSMFSDRLNERKEPVLGKVAADSARPKLVPVQQPVWLKQELDKLKKAESSQSAAPRVATSKSAAPAKTKNRKPVQAATRAAARPAAKPAKRVAAKIQPNERLAIDEVKLELQNLRDLMESQLSVLQWDRFSQQNPVRTVLLNLMSELGLGSDVCATIISHLDELSEDPHKVWQQALGIMASCMPTNRGDLMAQGGRIALVGSTGVGKTTTIAKIAARFAHIHGKRSVAMISTDQFRIGAQEQLQHFARLLEIPLLMAGNGEQLRDRIDMLADKKLVLIDTAGMSQSDLRLSEQFDRMHGAAPQIKPYLVLSANTQLAALNQTVENFTKVKLAGAIVTKLDEAASLGGILTTSIRHQLAFSFCGTGQKVPQDLERAKSHRLISKAVSLMQRYSEQQGQETLAQRYKHIINRNQA